MNRPIPHDEQVLDFVRSHFVPGDNTPRNKTVAQHIESMYRRYVAFISQIRSENLEHIAGDNESIDNVIEFPCNYSAYFSKKLRKFRFRTI